MPGVRGQLSGGCDCINGLIFLTIFELQRTTDNTQRTQASTLYHTDETLFLPISLDMVIPSGENQTLI